MYLFCSLCAPLNFKENLLVSAGCLCASVVLTDYKKCKIDVDGIDFTESTGPYSFARELR